MPLTVSDGSHLIELPPNCRPEDAGRLAVRLSRLAGQGCPVTTAARHSLGRCFKTTAREILTGQRRFDFAEAEARYADLEREPLLAGAGGRP